MEKIRFDDFIKLNRGFDLPDSQIEDGVYPVVASTNIKAHHSTYKVNGPMVVTGRSGSLGAVQYIEGKCWPLNTTLYVKDFKNNNPRYVYYFLKTMHLEQYNAGAGVPTLNQNHLHSLKINVHEKEDQRRIASILSAYDNLIENNNKRIRLLEQMAENLYKEWFVRFRFPGHETVEMENGLPKGWKYYLIRNLCEINKKTISSKNKSVLIHYLDTSSITDNCITGYEDYILEDAPSRARRMVKHNSIVFSTVRPNLRHLGIIKNPEDNTIVSTGFAVFDCKCQIANIIYRYLASPEIVNYCQSIAEGAVATYPSIKPEEIGRLKIALPPLNIAQQLNNKLEVLNNQQNKLLRQNDNLTRQRDLLLPRLMSGKLEVKVEE